MKIIDWITRTFAREFPKPIDGTLTLDEFYAFYRNKLTDDWRAECALFMYRIDPGRAPFKAIHKMETLPDELPVDILMPSPEWWRASEMPLPYKAAYCIRLQRTWQTRLGPRTQEICVASFQVAVTLPDEAEVKP